LLQSASSRRSLPGQMDSSPNRWYSTTKQPRFRYVQSDYDGIHIHCCDYEQWVLWDGLYREWNQDDGSLNEFNSFDVPQ
jgi:hypothetical protein